MTSKKHERVQPEPVGQNGILIVMPSWIGDTVMATPVLHRVREAYPHERIEILASSWVAPLLRSHPSLDNVWSYEPQGPVWSVLRIAASIRSRNYDLALLMPNSFRSALLALMGGVRVRAGYRADGRGWLLTRSLPRDERACSLHMVEYYVEILKAIGIDPMPSAPKLWIDEEQRLQAARIFEENGVEAGRSFVGILPGAQNSIAKMWLSDRFARMADRIVNHLGATVVFFGGSSDSGRIEEVRRQMREPSVSLGGKIPLGTLSAAIERCRVFVANDTGPMHVASAVGTPVVAIFGPTDPRITAPYSGPRSLITANVSCAPCGKRACERGLECMRAISVDDVLAAVEHQMSLRQ